LKEENHQESSMEETNSSSTDPIVENQALLNESVSKFPVSIVDSCSFSGLSPTFGRLSIGHKRSFSSPSLSDFCARSIRKRLEEQQFKISEQEKMLQERDTLLQQKEKMLNEHSDTLNKMSQLLSVREKELSEKESFIGQLVQKIQSLQKQLEIQDSKNTSIPDSIHASE